jgi:hypothetical protein
MGSPEVSEAERDEFRIAGGIDVRRPSGEEIVALMRTLAAKVDISRRQGSLRPLMEFLYSSLSGAAAKLSEYRIACGRGCSHCCHSPWIEATPVEALFAVASLSQDQRARVRVAVDQLSSQLRGKSMKERAALVPGCPLLELDSCGSYDARPIVCRSLVSIDANACRRAYIELSGEGLSGPSVWHTLGAAHVVALEAALLHAGLEASAREWVESLRIALEEPDAESRWLAGERLFTRAPRSSSKSNFDAPAWAHLYRRAFGASPPSLRP